MWYIVGVLAAAIVLVDVTLRIYIDAGITDLLEIAYVFCAFGVIC